MASVGMSCSLEMSGGCLGSVWAPDSGGISEWYSWKLEALGCGGSGTTLKVVSIGLFGCLGVKYDKYLLNSEAHSCLFLKKLFNEDTLKILQFRRWVVKKSHMVTWSG